MPLVNVQIFIFENLTNNRLLYWAFSSLSSFKYLVQFSGSRSWLPLIDRSYSFNFYFPIEFDLNILIYNYISLLFQFSFVSIHFIFILRSLSRQFDVSVPKGGLFFRIFYQLVRKVISFYFGENEIRKTKRLSKQPNIFSFLFCKLISFSFYSFYFFPILVERDSIVKWHSARYPCDARRTCELLHRVVYHRRRKLA